MDNKAQLIEYLQMIIDDVEKNVIEEYSVNVSFGREKPRGNGGWILYEPTGEKTITIDYKVAKKT